MSEEARLLQVLNDTHTWPTVFTLKFIVPSESAKALEAIMPKEVKFEVRPSKNGKYIGYTYHCPVNSAQEVLDLYSSAKGVPGLLSL